MKNVPRRTFDYFEENVSIFSIVSDLTDNVIN